MTINQGEEKKKREQKEQKKTKKELKKNVRNEVEHQVSMIEQDLVQDDSSTVILCLKDLTPQSKKKNREKEQENGKEKGRKMR